MIAAKLAVNFSSFARHATTNVACRNFSDLELSQQRQIVWFALSILRFSRIVCMVLAEIEQLGLVFPNPLLHAQGLWYKKS